MKKFWLLLAMVSLVGCATMTSVGPLSKADEASHAIDMKYKFIVVHTRDVLSPSTTTLFMYNTQDGSLTKVEGGAGTGLLGAIAGPAATAYGMREIGRGIKKAHPDQSYYNNSNSNSSRNSAIMRQGQGQGQWQRQAQQGGLFLRPRYPVY